MHKTFLLRMNLRGKGIEPGRRFVGCGVFALFFGLRSYPAFPCTFPVFLHFLLFLTVVHLAGVAIGLSILSFRSCLLLEIPRCTLFYLIISIPFSFIAVSCGGDALACFVSSMLGGLQMLWDGGADAM